MASTKYAAAGMESQFQPGSRGRVLRNLLGITRVREMDEVESQALTVAQESAVKLFGPKHRFTSADVSRLHRLWLWLGRIYPWAGNYTNAQYRQGRISVCSRSTDPTADERIWKGSASAAHAMWK